MVVGRNLFWRGSVGFVVGVACVEKRPCGGEHCHRAGGHLLHIAEECHQGGPGGGGEFSLAGVLAKSGQQPGRYRIAGRQGRVERILGPQQQLLLVSG